MVSERGSARLRQAHRAITHCKQACSSGSHGLYFTLSYTYSHALDDYSGYESSYGNGTPNGVGFLNGRALNYTPGFEHLNYGNSDYDARHRFAALYTYEIPVLRSMKDHFIVNEILGKWHISGTTTALQTGFPCKHF